MKPSREKLVQQYIYVLHKVQYFLTKWGGGRNSPRRVSKNETLPATVINFPVILLRVPKSKTYLLRYGGD